MASDILLITITWYSLGRGRHSAVDTVMRNGLSLSHVLLRDGESIRTLKTNVSRTEHTNVSRYDLLRVREVTSSHVRDTRVLI